MTASPIIQRCPHCGTSVAFLYPDHLELFENVHTRKVRKSKGVVIVRCPNNDCKRIIELPLDNSLSDTVK